MEVFHSHYAELIFEINWIKEILMINKVPVQIETEAVINRLIIIFKMTEWNSLKIMRDNTYNQSFLSDTKKPSFPMALVYWIAVLTCKYFWK